MTASLLDKRFYYKDRFFLNLLRQRPVFRQIISCCKICLQLLVILGYLLLNIDRRWFHFFCPKEGRGSLFRWQLKVISIVLITVGIDMVINISGSHLSWPLDLLPTGWLNLDMKRQLLKFNVCQITLIISLLSFSKANKQTSQPPSKCCLSHMTL